MPAFYHSNFSTGATTTLVGPAAAMGETAIGLYQQHQPCVTSAWFICGGTVALATVTSSHHRYMAAIAVGASFSTVATTLGPATAMGELAIGGSITMITSHRHDDLCVICVLVPHMNEEVALSNYVFLVCLR